MHRCFLVVPCPESVLRSGRTLVGASTLQWAVERAAYGREETEEEEEEPPPPMEMEGEDRRFSLLFVRYIEPPKVT